MWRREEFRQHKNSGHCCGRGFFSHHCCIYSLLCLEEKPKSTRQRREWKSTSRGKRTDGSTRGTSSSIKDHMETIDTVSVHCRVNVLQDPVIIQ
ncbi:hypothetical protein INR49_000471 [Caranx melampygus]|nr:hypothetical protein INR49_000471 [Caranx melampygus]